MTTTHQIPTTLVDKYNTGKFEVQTDHIFRIDGRYRLGIGGVARGDEGRQVTHGPLVPGPWAYAYGLCTVMCSEPEHGTYGEMKRLEAANKVHDVASGDHAVIDDVEYEIEVYRRQYIRLTKVEK
jgi:hypothetical protein